MLTKLATGVWSYTVPNAATQYLGAGETKVETFTVHALDGTAHVITITITGTNDAPVFSDRKSTRLNSSHYLLTHAAFCLQKNADADQNQSGIDTIFF